MTSTKFWPADIPKEMEVGDETLWDGLAAQAEIRPHDIGVEFLGRSETWSELLESSLSLAGGLQKIGVKSGDRVALLAQNCTQYVIAFHAILRCGGVVVPINPMNKALELSHCIDHSGAKVAISSVDLAKELVLANNHLEPNAQLKDLVTFSTAEYLESSTTVPAVWSDWLCARHDLPDLAGGRVHDWSVLMAEKHVPSELSLRADGLALLMFTSGTTGLPKACMHSHRTIMSNVIPTKFWQDLNPGDVSLLILPLFHITGLVGALLSSVYYGVKTVILPRWDRRIALKSMQDHKVTHWTNIPTMVVDLLAEPEIDTYDISTLRHVGGGGASMPNAVAEHLKAKYGLDFYEGYGMTETAAPTHSNPRCRPKFQCLGIPVTNTHARVMDLDTLKEAAVGEQGEIVVSGPQVFLGYWKNEAATKASFLEIDGRNWLRTGDLGRMDEEGYYFIADRLKRMINASGFKIWPAEVEGLLYGHPSIQEVCIIAAKDPYRGETTKALIVLRDGNKDDTTSKDIVLWAKENMSAYKVPKQIEFVDSLLKGPTGKINWRALQDAQNVKDNQKG